MDGINLPPPPYWKKPDPSLMPQESFRARKSILPDTRVLRKREKFLELEGLRKEESEKEVARRSGGGAL